MPKGLHTTLSLSSGAAYFFFLFMEQRCSQNSGLLTKPVMPLVVTFYSLEMTPQKVSTRERFKRFSSDSASLGGKFPQI